uniref:RNA helicase n=1 Tax=Steinernema glaseri TaxID=37863 RepID=A0A1I8AHA8_9BILA
MVSFEDYPEIFSDDESSEYDKPDAPEPTNDVASSASDGSEAVEDDDCALGVKPINVSVVDVNPDLGVNDVNIAQFKNLNLEARTVSMTIANEHIEWHDRGMKNAERKLLETVSSGEGFKWGTKTNDDPVPELVFSRTVVPTASSPTNAVKKSRWHALAPEDSQMKCANICEQLGIGILQPPSSLIRPKKKMSGLPDIDFGDLNLTLKATSQPNFVDSNVVVTDGYVLDNANEGEDGEWITVSNKEKDHSKSGSFGRGFGKPTISDRRTDDNGKTNLRQSFSKSGGFPPYGGGFAKSIGTPPMPVGGFMKAAASMGFSRSFDPPASSPMTKRNPNFLPKGSPNIGGYSRNSAPRGLGGGANGGFGAGVGANGQQSETKKGAFGGGFAAPGFGTGIGQKSSNGHGGFGKPFGGGFAKSPTSPTVGPSSWTAPEKTPAAQDKWDDWEAKPVEQKTTAKAAGGWEKWNKPTAAGDAGDDKRGWDKWDS